MATPLPYGMSGQRAYSLYYQHSGRVPLVGGVMTAGVAVIVAVAGAFVYAYIDLYMPIVYVNLLATIGFGALIGFTTTSVARAAKVRNIPVVYAIVGVATLVAYYCCWIFWIKAAADRYISGHPLTIGGLIESPGDLLEAIKVFNENGTWSIGKGKSPPLNDGLLLIVWLAEAGLIFGFSFFAARAVARADMFCERCGRWCAGPRNLRQTAAGDPAYLRQQLEARDFAHLNALGSASPGRFWSVEYSRCESCDTLHALSVVEVTIQVDKKGIQQTIRKPVMNRLLLEAKEAEALTSHSKYRPEA